MSSYAPAQEVAASTTPSPSLSNVQDNGNPADSPYGIDDIVSDIDADSDEAEADDLEVEDDGNDSEIKVDAEEDEEAEVEASINRVNGHSNASAGNDDESSDSDREDESETLLVQCESVKQVLNALSDAFNKHQEVSPSPLHPSTSCIQTIKITS